MGLLKYRPEIDGLRALAVVAVVFFHAGLAGFTGGYVGVDVFFVVSGYLITSIILADAAAGQFSLARFYERRARRILPALLLVAAICVPFAFAWLLPRDMKSFSTSLAAVTIFASNVLFWKEAGYFDAANEFKPLVHTWSLGVEEQFYILFPFVVLLALRLGRNSAFSLLATLLAASLAAAHWGAYHNPAATFFLLPTRLWELLVGALLALHHAAPAEPPSRAVAEGGSLLGLVLIAVAVFAFDRGTPFPSLYTVLPAIGTALVIKFVTRPTTVGRLLARRPLVWIGLMSYSIYLWHQVIFAFARHRAFFDLTPTEMMALALASVPLAYLSWKFVEQPFRRSDKVGRTALAVATGLASLVLFSIGVAGNATDGFMNRYNAADRQILAEEEARRSYVFQRLGPASGRGFDEGKHKVLIVGDSFAGDLLNAIGEIGQSPRVTFSSHTIRNECGNLFVRRDFLENIEPRGRELCKKNGWYSSPRLQELIRQADEVWLVSNWRQWESALVPESLANLEAAFGHKFLVVGLKTFGEFHLKRYLGLTPEERSRAVAPPLEELLAINRSMAGQLRPDAFLDLQAVLCGPAPCRLFDEAGNILSVDGGHLTPAGAVSLGRKLVALPRFRGVFAVSPS